MSKLQDIFSTMITLVIALALTGTIQAQVTGVIYAGSGNANVTGSAKTLIQLVPLFWVIMVLGIGIGAIYLQWKKK